MMSINESLVVEQSRRASSKSDCRVDGVLVSYIEDSMDATGSWVAETSDVVLQTLFDLEII